LIFTIDSLYLQVYYRNDILLRRIRKVNK
jgi:hypothetical protein